MRRHVRYRVFALVMVLACPAGAGAEDELATARRLYAAAAYEDALKTLEHLSPEATGASAVAVQQQRLLCLIALGRPADAEQAMTAIVRADPLYLPDATSAPPRIRAAFRDVRARLVPGIAKSEYERARETFEAGDYAAASAGFARVLAIVAQSDGANSDPVVRDVVVLAMGFKTLSDKANEPPPPATAPTSDAHTAPPVAAARSIRIYDAAYPGLVVPQIIRQTVPQWPRNLGPPPNRDGVIEVVVNEEGLVESARMAQPVNRAYDRILLTAASTWAYSPAQLGGERVKVRKKIKLSFR